MLSPFLWFYLLSSLSKWLFNNLEPGVLEKYNMDFYLKVLTVQQSKLCSSEGLDRANNYLYWIFLKKFVHFKNGKVLCEKYWNLIICFGIHHRILDIKCDDFQDFKCCHTLVTTFEKVILLKTTLSRWWNE